MHEVRFASAKSLNAGQTMFSFGLKLGRVWLPIATVMFGMPLGVAAQSTVSEVLQQIAARHNASNVHDDMTVSSRASANEKNLTFTNILRVMQNVPPAKLQELSQMLFADVAPKVCDLPGNKIGFDKGMSYTFVYDDTYGERLAAFRVDKKVCTGL